jgi:hypothetical protein
MSWPYPFNSSFNPANNYMNIDYSMTSPLFADGSNFPCKGYHTQINAPNYPTVDTITAGQSYNVSYQGFQGPSYNRFAGTATHGGGSCQFSLSYDQGNTWAVIHSIIGGCPLNTTYSFNTPNEVPSGNALFGWTWFNKLGNRYGILWLR